MKKLFANFKSFILKGNVLDLAVGVIIGGAFGAIVNSLVKDILMPPIGMILGKVDFTNLFVVLSRDVTLPPNATIEMAKEAGAVTWNYGLFINSVISFLIIAVAVFGIVHILNKLQDETKNRVLKEAEQTLAEPTEKACPFCFQTIPVKATRCPFCTSTLDE